MRNRIKMLVCLLTLLSMLAMNGFSEIVYASGATDAPATDPVIVQPKVIVTKSVTNPGKVKAGEEFDLSVTMKNTSNSVALKDLTVTITPSLDQFALCSVTDYVYQENVKAGAEVTVTYRLQAKSAVESGQYTIPLTFDYTDGNGISYTSQGTARVNITGKAQNNEVEYQPKLIVTKSKTNPKNCKAGEEFDLTVTLKNTSSNMEIRNMTISIAPDQTQFAVCNATDSIFAKKLGAEKEMTVTYRLKAMDTLGEGQYSLPLTCDYVDTKGNPYTYAGNARVNITSKEQKNEVESQPKLIVTKSKTTPKDIKAGGEFDLTVTLKNTSSNMEIRNMTITITPDQTQFAVCNATDSIFAKKLGAEKEITVTYRLKAMDTLREGQYSLPLTCDYIDTKGNPYTYTGNARVNISEAITTELQPNVIVTKSGTNPETVKAGEEFDLSITYKNVSNSMALKNLTVTIAPPVEQLILCDSTDSSYQSELGAGAEATISYKLKAKDIVENGQYTIPLTFSYVDDKGNPYSVMGTARVNIQNISTASAIKINFDTPSMPSEARIGEIINIDAGIQNLSKVKVYNVRAVVEADGLSQMETLFVGDMEPGTSVTGSSQITVSGLREGASSYGKTTGTITFYYEDESGKEYSEVKEITLDILTPFTSEEPIEQDSPTQWWVIISVIGVIIGGFLVIFLVRRFRGKEGA